MLELRISTEELKDQNRPNQPKLQLTESNHSHSTLAPKRRGSINDAAKAKARATTKEKKKAAEEEKKMSVLQQRFSKIKKEKLEDTIGPSTRSK